MYTVLSFALPLHTPTRSTALHYWDKSKSCSREGTLLLCCFFKSKSYFRIRGLQGPQTLLKPWIREQSDSCDSSKQIWDTGGLLVSQLYWLFWGSSILFRMTFPKIFLPMFSEKESDLIHEFTNRLYNNGKAKRDIYAVFVLQSRIQRPSRLSSAHGVSWRLWIWQIFQIWSGTQKLQLRNHACYRNPQGIYFQLHFAWLWRHWGSSWSSGRSNEPNPQRKLEPYTPVVISQKSASRYCLFVSFVSTGSSLHFEILKSYNEWIQEWVGYARFF